MLSAHDRRSRHVSAHVTPLPITSPVKVYLLAALSFPEMLPKLKSIAEWERLGGAGAVLLSGLFFYDIFWVFGSPVMVTVAKSLDAPI